MDGAGHGFVPILRQGFLFLIAVPQENGIIQGDAQLQHGGHGLGDVADFPEEVIGAHVVQDGNADAAQENQRQQERIHGERQHQGAQRHGDAHIDGFLILHQLLGIRHHGGQAGHEAPFSRHGPHPPDGLHGFLGGGTRIKKHGGQHAAAPLEQLPVVGGNDVQRQRALGDGGVADHGFHVGDFPDGVFHFLLRFEGHALRDQQGESALPEILQQNFLPLHRFQLLGQIIKQIVFGLGCGHAQYRGDHEHEANHNHQRAVPHQPSGKAFHFVLLPESYQTLC